ncbi:MAG TPA: hypothetical protein V6C65_31410 [Allocoleopsis sp.]
MQLNDFKSRFLAAVRSVATTLFCLLAIAFMWQGTFFSNSSAMAAPTTPIIASVNTGNQIQGKASEDAGRTKDFIRDTKERVKRTADKNADRVQQATDNDGGFFERKAQRDAARIHKRAEEDAARTQKAVDNTKNIVERTVDNIKDALSD